METFERPPRGPSGADRVWRRRGKDTQAMEREGQTKSVCGKPLQQYSSAVTGSTRLYHLVADPLKHRRQEKPPFPNYTAVERAGDHGSQRSVKARTISDRGSTALETSERTFIGSPVAAQPSIGHSRAISTDNPLKRGGPSGPGSISPERNLRASPSPRSGSRARIHSGVTSTSLIHKATDDHKAEAHSGRILPQGLDSPSPQRGILPFPKASQYESPRGMQPSCPPADSGATDPSQPVLEPKIGKGTRASPHTSRQNRGSGTLHPPHEQDEPEGDTSMLRQPETKPISHDQLVVEVKGIYAGLVMVEAKCIEVDERQKLWAQDKDYASRNPVTADQWKSLIALHKQLLHEHHDFFLASQHPSASNNLSRLAAKYIMPARMWRHGIHGFLEVLRHRLPGSLEHMLAFIYIAYNMMALLFETVPSFEDTWIECLGDLGRYRMAIEDDEPRDREIWSNVARYWYSKASDKSPVTGRLYHHLAILARPNTLEHLSLYTKSLTCIVPFESAKGSILTLLNPVLSGKVSVSPRNLQIEVLFIKAHAILFTYRINDFSEVLQLSQSNVVNDFLYRKVEKDRGEIFGRVKKLLAYLAIANVSGILEYGATLENGTPRSPIRREHDAMNVSEGEEFSRREEEAPGDTFMQKSHDTINIFELTTRMGSPSAHPTPKEQAHSSTIVPYASELAFSTMKYLISDLHWRSEARIWRHLLPFIHIMIVFIWTCCKAGSSMTIIERFIPWEALCVYLNLLADKGGGMECFVNSRDPFGEHGGGDNRPIWEDFLLRGLTYTLWYFPKNWFSKSGLDDEERQLELPSMDDARIARILELGLRIASVSLDREISGLD